MSGERTARMSIDEIEAVVLELPEDEREELLARLQAQSAARDTDDAWRAEVRRRIERIRAGDAEWFPLDEVLADEQGEAIVSRLASVALQISTDARAELADRLIASLTGNRGCDPAWEAEMNRRIDEIEAGTAKTLSEEEFFEKLRARRAARQVS